MKIVSWFIPLNLVHPISVSSSCQSFLTFLPNILCSQKSDSLGNRKPYDVIGRILHNQNDESLVVLVYFLFLISLISISFKKHLKH